MPKTRTLPDIPDSEVDMIVQDLKDEGATEVTKTKQANGLWSVTYSPAPRATSDGK